VRCQQLWTLARRGLRLFVEPWIESLCVTPAVEWLPAAERGVNRKPSLVPRLTCGLLLLLG